MEAREFIVRMAQGRWPTEAEGSAVLTGFLTMGHSLAVNGADLDVQSKKIVIEHLKAALQTADDRIRILAGSVLFALTDNEKALESAIELARSLKGDIAHRVANLNALAAMMFHKTEGASIAGKHMGFWHQVEYWDSLIDDLANSAKSAGVLGDPKDYEGVPGRTVVLLQQLLSPGHAPSRNSLEYCRSLMNDFGRDALLICTREFSPVPNGSIVPLFMPNAMDQYDGLNTVRYQDAEIACFQNPDKEFSERAVLETIAVIAEYRPEMIIAVGARNLVAELFADRAFVFTSPSTNNVPLVARGHFMGWREPNQFEVDYLEKTGRKERFLFVKRAAFEPPPRLRDFTRKEFGIPEDSFVISVVGHRLPQEVDDAFLDMMEELTTDPKVHFLFAGNFDNFDAVIGRRPSLVGRATSVGFQADIMGVLTLCNAYVSPIRSGGGNAILQAMASGLPSLCTNSGDGYIAVRDFPTLKNYEDMAAQMRELMADEALYNEWKEKGEEIAGEQLAGRRILVGKVVDAFEEWKKKRQRAA